MLLLLGFAIASVEPVLFGVAPIASEMARGGAIYRSGSGLERVFLDDRQVVGRWFDGRVKRDVEEIVWISPRLVSRVFGYRRVREGWSEDETLARWEAARGKLNGRMTFLCRLAALPKIDLLESDLALAPDPLDLRNLTAVLDMGGRFFAPLSGRPHGEVQGRDWQSVAPSHWPVMAAEIEIWPQGLALTEARYPLGDYRAAYWSFWTEVPPEIFFVDRFEVRLLGRTRDRAGRFSLRDRS